MDESDRTLFLNCCFGTIDSEIITEQGQTQAYCISQTGLDWTGLVKRKLGLVKGGLAKRALKKMPTCKTRIIKGGLLKHGIVKRELVKSRRRNVSHRFLIDHCK